MSVVGTCTQYGNLMPPHPAPSTPSVHPLPSPGGPLVALSFHTEVPRGEGCLAPPYIGVQIFCGELGVTRRIGLRIQCLEGVPYIDTALSSLTF